MYMRHNGEGVGHCHNPFPVSENVVEVASDDEMEIDNDDSAVNPNPISGSNISQASHHAHWSSPPTFNTHPTLLEDRKSVV